MPTWWQNTLTEPEWKRLLLNYQIRNKNSCNLSGVALHLWLCGGGCRFTDEPPRSAQSRGGEGGGGATAVQITLIFHVRRRVSVQHSMPRKKGWLLPPPTGTVRHIQQCSNVTELNVKARSALNRSRLTRVQWSLLFWLVRSVMVDVMLGLSSSSRWSR